jgi:hypothetical protein
MEIRDAIHGNIYLSDVESAILDTPSFQRLRRIKQLGFTYLVYPGANHTRFEHSLGVMHILGRISERLNLSESKTTYLRLAGLLHDIGHGPYSHTSEMFLHEVSHEAVTKEILLKGEIRDILSNSKKKILNLIINHSKYAKLIHGDIDADRMDYLVRDSYYTGVAYGIVDLERLFSTIKFSRNELIVTDLFAAEALLRARFLMFPTVYEHHAVRIAEAMFAKAVQATIQEGLIQPKEISKMDDISLLAFLRNTSGKAKRLITLIDNRCLYKRALVLTKRELGHKKIRRLLKIRKDPALHQEIEDQIAKTAKIDNVILDIPMPLYKKSEINFLYESAGQRTSAIEASTSIKTLATAQWDYWKVLVACPKKNLLACRRAAKKVLETYLS